MLASIVTYLIPVFVLAGLVVLLGTFALVSRIQGGKYVRPLVNLLLKMPLVGRWMKKAGRAALERQNPELASAIRKLERSGAVRDPSKAQRAMSSLTAAERHAYIEAAEKEGTAAEQPVNRAMRRQLARQKKR